MTKPCIYTLDYPVFTWRSREDISGFPPFAPLLLILPVCHQLHTGGIIILKDTSEEEEELVEPVSAHGPKIEEEEQEPEPPEPFEYIDE